jgi:glycerophosphoryl diester phosphodiesterase
LFDALDSGFCSIEADIHLVNGKLLVAHDREFTRPERTLEALYLDPLRERVKMNGGRVYPGGPEVTLLIELKSDWRTLYPALLETLKRYEDILTTFHFDAKEPKAITAIITGNRSLEMFRGETVRLAAMDGDLRNLDADIPASLIPWISDNWTKSFQWQGTGPFAGDEKAKLKAIVEKAHAKGRRVRFWGAPDQPVFWQQMLANGVDLINTDDLLGLQRFLNSRN